MVKIILASASPRRKQLLKTIVEQFEVISSNVEETYPSTIDPFKVSLYLAELKASDIYKNNPQSIVIGSDTTIVFNNTVIGKPASKEHAKEMLTKFSNNMHYVVTGVVVIKDNLKYSINSISKVYFKQLSESQIDEYLINDEYKDKAGSYAIQGIANKFIDHIDGDYNSIVGLPTLELDEILKKINY